MALFGTRPGRLFPDAEIRAMLLWGKRDDPVVTGYTGVIYTTDARKFFQRDRATTLATLSFECTTGLELGERSIGDGTADISLPKIGIAEIRRILIALRKKSGIVVRDRVNKSGYSYHLTIRATGGYWLTALEEFPYKSSKLRQLALQTQLERDFLLLVVNSSLFYLFWSTYSNLRDFKIGDLLRFPFPSTIDLIPQMETIHTLALNLAEALKHTFEPFPDRRGGRQGEFHPGQCLAIIHEVDDLICPIYGLSIGETSFVKTYDQHLRKCEK